MKHRNAAPALIASAFILASAASLAQQGPGQRPGPEDRAQAERGQMDRDRDFDRDRLQDRDQMQDRDRPDRPDQDRDRDRDRIHAPDFARLSDNDIYGRELLTAEERNEYRTRLQNAETAEERKQIQAEHRELVRARAQEQGVEPAPPGRGIYGGAMMSLEERLQYREQLRLMDSAAERQQFMAQHRAEMQQRARAQGVPFEQLEETEEPE